MTQDVVAYLRTIETALEVWFRQMARSSDPHANDAQRSAALGRLRDLAVELNGLVVPPTCEAVHERMRLALRRWIVAEELREVAPEAPITRRAQRAAALAFVAFRTALD